MFWLTSANRCCLTDPRFADRLAVRLAVGSLAAKQLYNRACQRESMYPQFADCIISREAYFQRCSGFELLRIRYYFDAEDLYDVMSDLAKDEPPTLRHKEHRSGKTRFCEFASSASSRNS